MKETEFKKLPEIGDVYIAGNKLKKGDFFLYGNHMISQKETKKIGDKITYYKLKRLGGSNIEYTPVYDVLEKNF